MNGFGLDHLPYGVFSVAGGPRRVGVRFDDDEGAWLVDLHAETGRPEFARAVAQRPHGARPRGVAADPRRGARLIEGGAEPLPLEEVTLHLPVEVADYVDFYASLDHATNVGKIFRPDSEPLTPELAAPADRLPRPGRHGRGLRYAGHPAERAAQGARRGGPDVRPVAGGSTSRPSSASSSARRPSSGAPVPFTGLADHVFGVTGLNDWSARDIQAWEYVPLGPFLGKSFATSISPWVTPLAALDAAWVDLPGQDPEPLALPRPGRDPRPRHRRRGAC